jgi:hypothetical protein
VAPTVEEARLLIQEEETRLRRLSYDELRNLGTVVKDVRGPSGYSYNMEIESFWDSNRDKTLRVIVSVFPWWGWGIVQPRELTTDFIMAPDGSFVGE